MASISALNAVASAPATLTTGANLGTPPWWGDVPAAWDTVRISDIDLPGVCRVGGKGFEQKLQRRSIPGQHGESLSFLGKGAAEIDIEVNLWEKQHLLAFARIIPALRPAEEDFNRAAVNQLVVKEAGATPGSDSVKYVATGKTGNLVDALPGLVGESEAGAATTGLKVKKLYLPTSIYHPALAMFGITTVHVVSISVPDHKGGGLYVSRIHCLEYIPEVLRRSANGVTLIKKKEPAKHISTIGQAPGFITPAQSETDRRIAELSKRPSLQSVNPG